MPRVHGSNSCVWQQRVLLRRERDISSGTGRGVVGRFHIIDSGQGLRLLIRMTDCVEIYGLMDPRENRVRYVGKAVCATARLKTHLRDCARRSTPIYGWIRAMLAEGVRPVTVVLCRCAVEDWPRVEREEIAKARSAGLSLFNVAPGGNQPFCPLAVRKQNGPKAVASRTSTPRKARLWHLRQQIGIALRRGYVAEETRARLRYIASRHPAMFGCWASV